MEDDIKELSHRSIENAEAIGEVAGDLEDLTKKVEELTYRVVAAEKALQVLSNTLHVIDATSLLSLYSLIKTDNLRQPDFKSNQDIIDSGCSDAINRMMKTVVKVNAAEKKNASDTSK